MDITMLAGPVIGSVIGYCTNSIAVKMLFYPRKEIRILGHKLPFTPGAIPKGKDRLAEAMGDVVGNRLITQEDIEKKLLSDDVTLAISGVISEVINVPVMEGIAKTTNLPKSSIDNMCDTLAGFVSKSIVEALSKVDFSAILVEKAPAIIKSKIQNPMISMFLSEEMLASMLAPMGDEIKTMVLNEGFDYINPLVKEKVEALADESVLEISGHMEIDEQTLSCILTSICMSLVRGQLNNIMEKLDIKSIVEEKVKEMDVEQVEEMVMTVMKKELNTIVNLGALIGLILGLFNMLF